MNTNAAVNGWALSKRIFHWGFAASIVVVLLASKPEDGGGALHIIAGSTALAFVLLRLCTRLIADVRPRIRDAWRMRFPDFEKLGVKALAMPAAQFSRLLGFALLAAVLAAAATAILGIGGGEDSPLLEVHEAAGNATMVLAIAHAAFSVVSAYLMRVDILGVTLLRSGPALEGGVRGALGMIAGAAVAGVLLFYAWGPYDLLGKAAKLSDEAGRSGEAHEED